MNSTFGFHGLLKDAISEARKLAVKYDESIRVWDIASKKDPDCEVQGVAKSYTLATDEADRRVSGIMVARVWPGGTLDVYSKRFAERNGL
jgi:hypothetical protein